MSEDTDPAGDGDDNLPDDQEDSADDRPALDEDERASFDPDQARELAGEVAAEDDDADSDDEAAESGDESDADGEPDDAPDAPATTASTELEDVSVSWGDIYVETISVLLVAVVEEETDGQPELGVDEIAAMAEEGPVDIPAQVDQLVADMMGGSLDEADLAPEYALLLGTGLLAFRVIVTETDVLQSGLSEALSGATDDTTEVPA
jgi:hypothetical protein